MLRPRFLKAVIILVASSVLFPALLLNASSSPSFAVFSIRISDELTDLRTIKDASFQSWNSLAQVREAATILVQSFGELLDQAEHDVQRWEEYPVSVHQSVVDDVTCKAAVPPAKASPSLCKYWL